MERSKDSLTYASAPTSIARPVSSLHSRTRASAAGSPRAAARPEDPRGARRGSGSATQRAACIRRAARCRCTGEVAASAGVARSAVQSGMLERAKGDAQRFVERRGGGAHSHAKRAATLEPAVEHRERVGGLSGDFLERRPSSRRMVSAERAAPRRRGLNTGRGSQPPVAAAPEPDCRVHSSADASRASISGGSTFP